MGIRPTKVRVKVFEYEGIRRICYPNRDEGEEYGSTFVPICPSCGRFVKADPTMSFVKAGSFGAIKPKEPNATCKKCGRVAMPFEGFI